jgi:hypothetical protein
MMLPESEGHVKRYIITSGTKLGVMHMVDVYDGERHVKHYNVATMKQARNIVKGLKIAHAERT